jgi:Skp family chaperone for outer membrane proteins
MKKNYLLSMLSVILFSCSKNSEQIDIAKSMIEKNVSDIEKKDIKYTCVEISDREAYNEIFKFHEKKSNTAQSEYEELAQQHVNKPLEEMSNSELKRYNQIMQIEMVYLNEVSKFQKLQSEDQKELAKAKGEKTYFKITGVKTIPDTILHTKVYLDNNNKIINTQYLK